MSILNNIVVIDGEAYLKLSPQVLEHIGYTIKGKGNVQEIAAFNAKKDSVSAKEPK